ncbi:hypothetical protein GUJ93_ZPchr0013g34776 [Zizania palustris]|uniref:Uncharacterized protein n=1 Tax=Zizania palustris TaxID=103762 RepID=A0A8J5WZN5_ZIZPA|nr:hypothetical protein GUJ93_ZPchr0013g34776 [Zizania palustris]
METAATSTLLAPRPIAWRLPAASLPLGRARRRLAVAGAAPSTTNYVVLPLDAAPSGITRPLVEINKRVPDTVVRSSRRVSTSDPAIPWYHANRMLIFYAPAWCGEVRDVIYTDGGR